MRVAARDLLAYDYVRLQGRKVTLTSVDECSDRPGYLLLRGTYHRSPVQEDEVGQWIKVPVIHVVKESKKIPLLEN